MADPLTLLSAGSQVLGQAQQALGGGPSAAFSEGELANDNIFETGAFAVGKDARATSTAGGKRSGAPAGADNGLFVMIGAGLIALAVAARK